MKKITLVMTAWLSVFFTLSVVAQERKVAKADKLYDDFAYIDAITVYENIVAKGYSSPDLLKKLANAYYFNAEFQKANKWYTELFALGEEPEPEYFYRYSQTLKSIGDYEKSAQMMDRFSKKNVIDGRGKLYEEDKDYLSAILDNSGRYSIESAGINSEGQDYGTTFYKGSLIFASSREEKGAAKRIDRWTELPFTNLYASKVRSDGTLEAPERFANEISSGFHEATPAFTQDGKTIYFTRNNYNNGKNGRSKDRRIVLKIYKATFEDEKWRNVTELPFNNDEFNTAHPALSPDDKTLYFASDRPGSIGQSDIYKVSINADGTFGKPENLGKEINTEGKETFPFLSDENELYFASDGHPGLGGLDIFRSKMGENGFEKPQNVGTPVNGGQDDFAFMIDTKSQGGFFSSNRNGGMGYDDIYRLKENRKLENEQFVEGQVRDSINDKGLENVKLGLYDDKFKLLEEAVTDRKGNYIFKTKLQKGKRYHIRAEKKDYLTDEKNIEADGSNGFVEVDIALQKRITEIREKGNIADAFGIRDIYFDFDEANIRPDAALDLEKIIDVMRQYPGMTVAIRCHTDSRGTREYNLKLSQRRANAVKQYMIEHGIDSSRLSAKGYGETLLRNGCSDGVECTEREHEINRRSEFVILKIK
ncbi:OmpA family protein [Flavobacterium lindanitolerans]|uniref:OmpA family protein n=1 Tax=Flavobacterium lindanitolerans TaxID=428988 RepID=UPI002807B683|nr:OmpA family protein [Flavobacterium lindanitolerans]MDQ7960013.1 OmpA family protein [Flavobacterium lindanitolerans]